MDVTLNEYQKQAMRTANPELAENQKVALSYAALKIAGEAGEIADYVGKWLGQGHDLDENKLLLECGDLLWHLAYLLSVLGFDMDTCAEANIAKLMQRYPDGFDSRRSRLRREVENMIG